MLVILRSQRAICIALVSAGAAWPAVAAAQSPIDVPTLVTIAPQEEAPSAAAPRSSFDYEAARPWNQAADQSKPWNAQHGAIAAAPATIPTPSLALAFTGGTPPLSCRGAAYRIILDDRSELKSGTLCVLPDGTWQLLP